MSASKERNETKWARHESRQRERPREWSVNGMANVTSSMNQSISFNLTEIDEIGWLMNEVEWLPFVFLQLMPAFIHGTWDEVNEAAINEGAQRPRVKRVQTAGAVNGFIHSHFNQFMEWNWMKLSDELKKWTKCDEINSLSSFTRRNEAVNDWSHEV